MQKSFSLKVEELRKQKALIDGECLRLQGDRTKFEELKKIEEEKIAKAKERLMQEKAEIEKMKKQMAEKKEEDVKKREESDPATRILEEEFQKGQEFFMLKLQDLKIEKQIGAGASAEVYKGTYKEVDVAIKKLRVF